MKRFKQYFSEQKSSEITKGWRHEDARMYAEKLVKAFGEPDEMSETRLNWNSIEPPFNEVWIVDESIPHDFPAPHRDYVYSCLLYTSPSPRD